MWDYLFIYLFLELSCFLYDAVGIGNLISDSSAFSKSSLYIWKFLVNVLLKPSLKDFEHYLSSEITTTVGKFGHSLALHFMGLE